MTNNRQQILRSVALIAVMSAMAGCAGQAQYFDRSDTITPGAGDAVAHNKSVHIINPRPRRAYNTHIHHSGERMSHAMDRYNAGPEGSQNGAAADGGGQNEETPVAEPAPEE